MKKIKFFIKYMIHLLKDKFGVYDILISNAQILQKQKNYKNEYEDLTDFEFKVFSQKGEDGIIQFLINFVEIPKGSEKFIEFGVETYVESNTRYLLVNNNWSGLVIDGDKQNINFIKKDMISINYDLKAIHSFITKDNINEIFRLNGFEGEIGLLSIDIDGNDYWVWDAINCINPIIIVAEYNSLFGNEKAVTTPYKEDFVRSKYHYSHLVFGASLKALVLLAEKKGYTFVGSNSNGTNAFFVRKDKSLALREFNYINGYVKSKFCEARKPNGKLYGNLNWNEKEDLIKGVEVFDVLIKQTIKL